MTTSAPIGKQMAPVGLIGLGAMGGAMATALLRAGHSVQGFDLDGAAMVRFVARGGRAAESAASACRGTRVLVVMVHDARQVDAVLFGGGGAVEGLTTGSVVWLASTVAPTYVRALAERLAGVGIALVDGPVSGGVEGAESGTLTVIAGGATEALATCRGVMDACASRVDVVGDVGAGSSAKMVNQVLVAAQIALTAEALVLGARSGIDPTRLIEVVRHSAGTSRMFEKRAPRMAAGDHAPHATVDTILKDLGAAIDEAAALGCRVPMAASARAVFDAAADAGSGPMSDTRVVDVYEQWAGARLLAEAV